MASSSHATCNTLPAGRSNRMVLDVASEVCSCRSSAVAFVTLDCVGSTTLPDPSIDEKLVKGCNAQNDLKSVLEFYAGYHRVLIADIKGNIPKMVCVHVSELF